MDARAEAQQSFGDWLRQRRLELDLTREDFARQVGCSTITLRKLEAEERRPSRQMAERLAEVLNVAPEDRPSFLQFTRGDPFSAPPASAQTAHAGHSMSGVEPLQQSNVHDLTDSDNPYKGLRAFGESDAADFFGREALTRQLLARLNEGGELARFLAVVGPSGCGKSSVVRSGLVPALRRGSLPGSDKWPIVQLLPGAHPLEELEAALLRIAVNPPESLLGQLHEDTRGLARAVRRCLPDDPAIELMLVVDQFEEIFTLVSDEAERAHLLDSLVNAVLDERSRVRIVITLRGDFLDRPLNYLDFGDLLRQRMEAVLPLSPDELERAIVGPAERLGLQWEAGLVPAILHSVADEPGTLPLLQYALTRLFEKRDGQRLTKAAYDAVGGVLGALGQRAEEVYLGLDGGQQSLVRQMFLRLVTLGEGVEDTRRRVLRSELEALVARPTSPPVEAPTDQAAITNPAIQDVLEAFGGQRLLSFDRDLRTQAPTVEVAHEALLREWARLREWLGDSRADVRLQRQLAAAADDWQRANRDASYLLIGSRLAQFEDWSANTDLLLTQAEREFLDVSLDERQARERAEADRQGRELEAARKLAESERQRADSQSRAARQLRRRALYLAGAFLLALVMAGTAVFFSQQAGQNAATAQQNAKVAQQNALAAQQNAAAAQQSAADSQNVALVSGSQAALANGDTDTAIALAFAAVTLNASSNQAQVALGQAAYAPGTVRLLKGHTDWVYAVAVSPDGRTALSGSRDQRMILWDLASGQEIRRFDRHNSVVGTVAFSPDGRTALSGSGDTRVILWDLGTGQVIQYLLGHSAWVDSVVFSPDGKTALSSSDDQTVIQWDLATGKAIQSLVGHTGPVESVAFSPDGKTALSGSDDHTLILWDLASGQPIRQFKGHTNRVNSVAFSPDGRTALSGANELDVIQWDVQTGQIVRRFHGHHSWVDSVKFSPDGRTALSGDFSGTAIYWDLGTGQAIGRLIGDRVAFSPDGRHAVVSDADNLRLWDLEGGQVVRPFNGNQYYVTEVVLSPDGRTALSAGSDGTAILWDVAAGQEIRRFSNSVPVSGVRFAPDGRTALLALGDLGIVYPASGAIVLYDLGAGQEIRHFTGVPASVWQVAFSPDGRTAVSGGANGSIYLWDVATGNEVRQFRGYEGNIALNVAFSPDGHSLLTGFDDGLIVLWDVATGRQIRSLDAHTNFVSGLAFSPDGRTVLAGLLDKTVILWDVGTGKILRRFTDHTGQVYAPQYSPDGRFAFAGSSDNSSIIWDLQSGQVVRTYNGRGAAVTSAAYARDGRSLLVGTDDGRVSLWRIDATLDDLLAWIHANRYVPELTCDQRALYRLTPACGANGAGATQTP